MKPFKFLVFDTETTGLLSTFDTTELLNNITHEPYVVQLAYRMCSIDENAKLTIDNTINALIRPDTRYDFIPEHVVAVHGITYEKAQTYGKSAVEVLQQFAQHVNEVDVVVAHNLSFDKNMLLLEFTRLGMQTVLANKHAICTMRMSQPYTSLAGTGKSLQSAYRYFNGVNFDGAHDALTDVDATVNVFYNCCKTVNIWPVPNSYAAVQVYSTAYHHPVPKYTEVNAWKAPAQIDICVFDNDSMIPYSPHDKRLSMIDKTYQLYIQQPQYDIDCCKDYNVDIDKCKVGYAYDVAMKLASHIIQCSSTVIVHHCNFQLGMINAAFKANELFNVLRFKSMVIDTAAMALNIWPNAEKFITRDEVFEKLYARKPTIDIIAANSVAQIYCGMIDYALQNDKMKNAIINTQQL